MVEARELCATAKQVRQSPIWGGTDGGELIWRCATMMVRNHDRGEASMGQETWEEVGSGNMGGWVGTELCVVLSPAIV